MHSQIHWPVTEPQKKGDRIDPSVRETWTAMEKLVDEVPPFYLPTPLISLCLSHVVHKVSQALQGEVSLGECSREEHCWTSSNGAEGGAGLEAGLTRHVATVLQGLVRNIGISNFSIKKTQEVLSFCRIRPAVNQVTIAHLHASGASIFPCISIPGPMLSTILTLQLILQFRTIVLAQLMWRTRPC